MWATSVPILVFPGLSILDLGPMYVTDRRQTYRQTSDSDSITWFSCLVRYPARKWSGSILTTPEPAWGRRNVEIKSNYVSQISTASYGCNFRGSEGLAQGRC